MNIFYLHNDPRICAEMHCDKHVVKMIIEYAQLMSTAHRVLDGNEYIDLTTNGRRIKRWRLFDDREQLLMKASHINHPSGVWCRSNSSNYEWLYQMWQYLCDEYTHRYGKVHSCARLDYILCMTPDRIKDGVFYSPPPAMPDECKIPNNSLDSYRKYYIEKKSHFAKWSKRNIPLWYSQTLNINDAHV